MKTTSACSLALALALGACQAPTGPQIVPADASLRSELFGPLKALAGRWQSPSPDGMGKYTEFAITSGGSVVRELMLPGDENEMFNMYALDGNSLVMTHYCAGGNQPRMRATALEQDRLVFRAEGVSDLSSKDQIYMGAMTLVFVDENHVQQHWSALKNGVLEQEMLIELKRVE